MNIKIKANKEMFDKFISTSLHVRGLSSIVQDDMDMDSEEFNEWVKIASDTINLFNNTITEVIKYVNDLARDKKIIPFPNSNKYLKKENENKNNDDDEGEVR